MPIRMDEDDWEDDNWDAEDDWDSEDDWDNTEIDTTNPNDWEDDFDEIEDDLDPEPQWEDKDTDTDWDDADDDLDNETVTDWDDDPETQTFDDEDIMDSYAVAKGDTLWKIAEDFYGDGSKYQRIFAANADILKNPNLIIPGTVLKIPYDE